MVPPSLAVYIADSDGQCPDSSLCSPASRSLCTCSEVHAAVDHSLTRGCRAYGSECLSLSEGIERVAIKTVELAVSGEGPLAQATPRPTCPSPFARHSFEPMHLFTW
jgi:hypothetical protein